MRHTAALWSLIALAGLAAGAAWNDEPAAYEEEGEEEGMEMGPPPPGYWRILGDAVPGWKPTDMHKGAPDGPITWSRLGPRPIRNEFWSGNANASGRIVSIAPHPTDANTCYIASASGGIWKTIDGGLNWSPLTDELSNLNHGAVALDPGNPSVVYVGTGEYTTSSGGDGLFRSPDGGVNWSRIATATQVGSNISKVMIDPTNPQVIHVTGSAGYARSTNGGTNWSFPLSGACSDLAVNPNDPQTVFVGRANDGVYRSTNGGATLTRLTGGLPTTGVRRVVLAMAQSNPAVVYCAITNASNGLLGMYKTIDGGNTWSVLAATPNFPSPQAWYDCCVGVDPANENTVYAGGVFPSYAVAGVIKTTNGGASWADITIRPGGQLHPDQHALAFGSGTLWVGNDGGVWKSTNAGSSWTNCNATLEVTQHYAIALDPTNPGKVAAGTQDNGSVARDLLTEAWPQTVAGDGGFCAVDFNTPTRRYFTYVYLTIYRLNGTSSTQITGPWGSDPVNFIAPLVMDPNNSRSLLGGTNRVWRTTNADASPPSWTAISTSVVGGGGTLNAIAVARGFSNTIYTGSSTGRVYVTTDASVWNDRSVGLPTGDLSDIIISPTDPGTAYVSYANTSGARILKTTTFGQSWTNVTGALPAGVRAKALEVDWRFSPADVYVGTGAGIYWSVNNGQTWTKDGTDLPNVDVGDLAIDAARSTITAGTYGRGAWRANLRQIVSCYANCDGSTMLPVLNVNDFVCFQTRFAAADPYADCDQNSTLNVNDFICYQTAFAAGCP